MRQILTFIFILPCILFAQDQNIEFDWADEYMFIESKDQDSIPYLLKVKKNQDALLSYTETMGKYFLDGFLQMDSTGGIHFYLYEELEGYDDSLPLLSLHKNNEVILTTFGTFRPQFFEPQDSTVYFKRQFDVIDHFTKYIGEYPMESALLKEPWMDLSLRRTLQSKYLSLFSFMVTRDEIYEEDSLILFEGLSVDKSGVGPSGKMLVAIDRFRSDLIVAYFDDYGQYKVMTKEEDREVPAIVNMWIEEHRIKEEE